MARGTLFVACLLLAAVIAAALVSPAAAVEEASAARASPAADATAGPSLADKIKHVVILMLENRSFVSWWLPHGRQGARIRHTARSFDTTARSGDARSRAYHGRRIISPCWWCVMYVP